MNAISSVCAGVSLTTSVVYNFPSPYAAAVRIGVVDQQHMDTENRWCQTTPKAQRSRLERKARGLSHQLVDIPREALGMHPTTVADALALLVMSLAELVPLRDGSVPIEPLADYVSRPTVGIDRATRLLAEQFGVSLAHLGANYCMYREPV